MSIYYIEYYYNNILMMMALNRGSMVYFIEMGKFYKNTFNIFPIYIIE